MSLKQNWFFIYFVSYFYFGLGDILAEKELRGRSMVDGLRINIKAEDVG